MDVLIVVLVIVVLLWVFRGPSKEERIIRDFAELMDKKKGEKR